MTSTLRSLLDRIDALRAEIDGLRPLDADALGRAMQRLRLEWTYHSNAIEGNSLDYGETRALLMHGVTAHGKPLKDHLDIRRHREVIEYLEAMVREGEPVTQATLRELHLQLMGDTYEVQAQTPDGGWITREEQGGAYKSHPNHVRTATGETHYYATPEETPARMTDLMDAFTRLQAEVEAGETHPLVAAATLHHGLVEIHPFADGNGRLARVLMNLLLMRAGFPPAVLRQERRDAYFGALAEADAGDLQPFLAFVAEEMEETMRLYLRALLNEPDPDAFSRRVAIMRREMGSEASPVFDSEAKVALGLQLLLPLLVTGDKRADELSPVFSDPGRVAIFTTENGADIRDYDEIRSALSGGNWVSFRMIWRFGILKSKPEFSISAVIEGSIGNYKLILDARPSGEKYIITQIGGDLPEMAQRIIDRAFESLLDRVEESIREDQ